MTAAVPTAIFDHALLRRRLMRAAAQPADFLLDQAADDLALRLATLKREFPDAVDLGTPGPQAARVLAARSGARRLLRALPVMGAGPAVAGQVLVTDVDVIPLGPQSQDLVASLLWLHWANDLPGVLAQIRAALRPDGLFLACLAGGRTLQELRIAFATAESELRGGASPRIAPFADVRDMGALLQRAGFTLPVTDAETLVVRYANAFALMRDLRAMGAGNVLVARERRPMRRDVLMRAAAIYAERFADPDGRIRATFELVWLSGWAAHESQQKPLRPGSAQMRLSDALGTREQHLP